MINEIEPSYWPSFALVALGTFILLTVLVWLRAREGRDLHHLSGYLLVVSAFLALLWDRYSLAVVALSYVPFVPIILLLLFSSPFIYAVRNREQRANYYLWASLLLESILLVLAWQTLSHMMALSSTILRRFLPSFLQLPYSEQSNVCLFVALALVIGTRILYAVITQRGGLHRSQDEPPLTIGGLKLLGST